MIPRHEDINTSRIVNKVFVLYTGGTIGMTRNDEDILVPAKHILASNLRALGTFHDQKLTAHNFLFSLTDAAAGASSCLESQYSKFMRLTSHTHYTQITAENKTLTQHICMLTCDNNYTEIFISHFCKTRLTMVSVLQRQSSATTNIRIHPGSCLFRK